MKFLITSALLVVCWTHGAEWGNQTAMKNLESLRKREERIPHVMVQLPEAEILRTWLIAKGFEELVTKTNLVNELAGKRLLLSQVLKIVDASYRKLFECSGRLNVFSAQKYKSNFYGVLFHNCPTIIQKLKEGGWISFGVENTRVGVENFKNKFCS